MNKLICKTTTGKGVSQRIGYARVSTDDQNPDLQRDALTRSGCATIHEKTASGKSLLRIELEHCCYALRSGDTLVVWRLECESITFKSLTEKIDMGSALSKL